VAVQPAALLALYLGDPVADLGDDHVPDVATLGAQRFDVGADCGGHRDILGARTTVGKRRAWHTLRTSMQIKWDEHGLVPAVAADATTGAVLMVAWMNAEALATTLATGRAHFYSRSRGRLWQKGETTGHTLAVRAARLDCDGDTVLLDVEPAGPACHTGKPSCFFRTFPDGAEDDGPRGAPAAVLDRVARVIAARRAATAETSYTRSLLDAGMARILAKIAEEHGELAAELDGGDAAKIVHEAADLVFHVLVGLEARGVPVAAVWAELERRFGRSGHDEKRSRG
jgi:phosphoribosyl-ATP pyrophosphohydrolase/phosphoribosyl-AMP cyclohydrolase